MAPRFVDFPLRIIPFPFDSPLADVIIELDHLRRLRLHGDTPPSIFFQLKEIFHTLESLGSARIEGNHTTLADYIESKITEPATLTDHIKEVRNIEEAMDYVEKVVSPGAPINEFFIRELHQLTVTGLEREGDKTPGRYRDTAVAIRGAEHLPPDPISVPTYMSELTDFINQDHPQKYDLLKMALAHHRFCWIHPFGNGNGRVVRLLSYAMLIKYGFNVQAGGRVLNPTAVFCNDRNAYYEKLAGADTGTNEGLEDWSLYVLGGVRQELEKIDNLLRYDYLRRQILVPALEYSKARELITEQERAVLSMAIEQKEFRAGDVDSVLPKLTARQRTYLISKLQENHMIRPVKPGGRTYVVNFTNSYLLRSVIHALENKGFIPPLIRSG